MTTASFPGPFDLEPLEAAQDLYAYLAGRVEEFAASVWDGPEADVKVELADLPHFQRLFVMDSIITSLEAQGRSLPPRGELVGPRKLSLRDYRMLEGRMRFLSETPRRGRRGRKT